MQERQLPLLRINFPQESHKLQLVEELRKKINIFYHVYYRGRGQPASCLRRADGAQRAMRAVLCGCFAAGARTSLTEPKERKWTQRSVQRAHAEDYKPPAKAGGS